MKIDRRRFIATGVTAAVGFTASRLAAQSTAAETPAPGFQLTPEEIARGQKDTAGRKPRQNLDIVLAFVQAGHKTDLARLKEFIAYDPKLAIASWDWGNGDWETALGGASHTAHPEIARYLLSQGARMDAFCAAMLGERETVRALLKADPATAATKGPHGFTLLYHAAASGDVAIAEAIKPLLPAGAKDFDQALGAAKRGAHSEMTKWLLENGATAPKA